MSWILGLPPKNAHQMCSLCENRIALISFLKVTHVFSFCYHSNSRKSTDLIHDHKNVSREMRSRTQMQRNLGF